MKRTLSFFSLLSILLSTAASAEWTNPIKCQAIVTSSKRVLQTITLEKNNNIFPVKNSFNYDGNSYDLEMWASSDIVKDESESILGAPILRAYIIKNSTYIEDIIKISTDINENSNANRHQVALAAELDDKINVLAQNVEGHLTLRCFSVVLGI